MRRTLNGVGLWAVSPRNGWLLTRMLAWRPVLSILKHRLPLPSLVQLVRPRRGGGPRSPRREHEVISLVRRLYPSPSGSDGHCLVRGLIVYRYLPLAHPEPELVVGVRSQDGETTGHVWVTLDGRPLAEPPLVEAEYVPMLKFAADGRQLRV